MSYENTYRVDVVVPNMIDEAGVDMTAEKAAAALERMAAELRENPEILAREFGRPFSSEVEDRWVLRKQGQPGLAMTADGWRRVKGTDIRPEDTMTSAEAASFDIARLAPKGVYWCRPEGVRDEGITVTLADTVPMMRFTADITDWLCAADEDEIAKLAGHDGGFDEVSGSLFDFLREQNEPVARRLGEFIDLDPETGSGEHVRIEVSVDEPERVRAFLAEARPDIFDAVFGEDDPQP